jgi:hypothetical protein
MLFVAFIALLRAAGDDVSPAMARTMFIVVGLTLIWLVIALVAALIYRERRQADLARLLAIKAGLQS